MIDRFIATCCQRRGIVWLVLLFVAAYGVYCWKQLPIEAYPDIADVTSQIVTQVPGLGAEEIEQQITIPLERALLVPAAAVLQSGPSTRVMVERSPLRFEPRTVQVGASHGEQVEIVSGLRAGERIVVKEGVLLND